jgi:hypothetical protein
MDVPEARTRYLARTPATAVAATTAAPASYTPASRIFRVQVTPPKK